MDEAAAAKRRLQQQQQQRKEKFNSSSSGSQRLRRRVDASIQQQQQRRRQERGAYAATALRRTVTKRSQVKDAPESVVENKVGEAQRRRAGERGGRRVGVDANVSDIDDDSEAEIEIEATFEQEKEAEDASQSGEAEELTLAAAECERECECEADDAFEGNFEAQFELDAELVDRHANDLIHIDQVFEELRQKMEVLSVQNQYQGQFGVIGSSKVKGE